MFKKQDHLFITFGHPAEQRRKTNRKAVSSFVSKSYRPTSKKIVFGQSNYRPFAQQAANSPASSDSSGFSQDLSTRRSTPTPDSQDDIAPLDETVLGNPLQDPFTSYPIPYKPYIPFFVDYFIRSLTPRFTPALDTNVDRYLKWFNVALQHPEAFHALIALTQMYQNIDVNGFGGPHFRSLYHRGETLKLLRHKVESNESRDDDASILTALWLLDVEYAHNDRKAWTMHKRAKEQMVTNRGGIQKLSPELQDELLKSEFFLPVLYYGRFIAVSPESPGNLMVMFREFEPFKPSLLRGLPPVFAVLASKRLLTTPVAEILQGLRVVISNASPNSGDQSNEVLKSSKRYEELAQATNLASALGTRSMEHILCFSLLIYVFNLQFRWQGKNQSLAILNRLAMEICSTEPDSPLTERECTLWGVVTIGAAASCSPWRSYLPFMGHVIGWLGNEHDQEKLTTTLRGYYLYGIRKEDLQYLDRWYARQ